MQKEHVKMLKMMQSMKNDDEQELTRIKKQNKKKKLRLGKKRN